MEMDFKGKRALVTGAGKGIGRALVKALWSSGTEIHAISRTQADLDSLQEECPGVHTICLDLAADWHKTTSAVEAIGALDILVNNAAVLQQSCPLTVTEEIYDAIFQTNVKSVLCVTKAVAKGMVERKQGGAIVNMSSVASSKAALKTYVYCASKGALDQLTRCLAVELGPHQIRVNSVNPAITPETDMGLGYVGWFSDERIAAYGQRCPLKGVLRVQHIVDATLYLLSDKADMINGAFLPIDGGFICT